MRVLSSIGKYRAEIIKRKFEPGGRRSMFKRYRLVAISAVILAMSVLVYMVCFAYKPYIVPQLIPNKAAQITIVSPFEFSFVSDSLTQSRRDQIAERVAPIYRINTPYIDSVDNRIKVLMGILNDSQYAYDVLSPEENGLAAFFEDISSDVRKRAGMNISPDDIRTMYEYTDEKNRANVVRQASFHLINLLREGVYQDGDEIFSAVSGLSNVEGVQSAQAKSESDARASFLDAMKSLGLNNHLTYALYRALNPEIRPDIEFDADKTKAKRDEARGKVQPVTVRVMSGETLVDSNSANTPISIEKMRAYKKELSKRGNFDYSKTRNYIEFIVSFLLVMAATLFITISKTNKNRKPRTIAIFSTLLLINLGVERVIIHFSNSGYFDTDTTFLQILTYVTPIMIGPIIQVLLFGAYTGFVMALLVAALTAMMIGEGVAFFVLFLASALLAIFFCNGANSRSRVILGGVFYGAFIALFALTIGWASGVPADIFLRQALMALIAGALTGIVSVGLLPLIERIFNQYSDVTLLDFTDFNNPLLRRLQMEAPGTYHHSVMVSYLAEQAAAAVGANALVCRIGSLYHDIGKIVKPEFFSENQSEGKNPHDDQNPSMSALIIKSHIKEGLELARMAKLPKQVLDAISQHHGTSIIAYFYNKAMKMAKDASGDDPDAILRKAGIEESTYRHEGVKPKTVENAIIMLADSCEAASRSLKKITQNGIEELVDAIVRSKINDGQLEDCPVTIRQVSKIKESFVFTMLNMLHSRVAYDNSKR